MKHQVVVVGAGPGGGATAVRLLQRGIKDVVLVDKDKFPREKTCGSALSPNGLKVVDQLGIKDEVDRLGYVIHSLRVITPGKREMKLTTEQAAVVLLRKHFDNLLVERAKQLGADFRGGWKATELIREGGRVVGVKSKDQEIRADYVLLADGAHSIFSWDQRPKRTISCLMGWWENFDFEPGTMEMIFDKNLSPLYGWMFPETTERVNIGICMDGEEDSPFAKQHGGRKKTTRNVRDVFEQFLQDYFADRLSRARQIGKFKGHPISYTTWIKDCTAPGVIYLGEGARITHNATGEGIYQAMQSGIFAADAVADALNAVQPEAKAFSKYLWKLRREFTASFLVGHALRGMLKTPMFDWFAMGYNSPYMRKAATWVLGSALAGSQLNEQKHQHAA